jgi:hypothetical protein
LPQYPGGWPHSAEKLAEADSLFAMPPKQNTAVPAGTHPDPDMWTAMFDTLSQTLNENLRLTKESIDENLKLTKSLIPRIEAIEAARSRSASPVDSGRQSPSVFAQPSQAPQSFVPPSQAPQSYAPLSVGSADLQQQRQ